MAAVFDQTSKTINISDYQDHDNPDKPLSDLASAQLVIASFDAQQ